MEIKLELFKNDKIEVVGPIFLNALYETAVSISELDENKNQLKKPNQPPPLPPVRYEEEVVYMPTLLTAENATIHWYQIFLIDLLLYIFLSKIDRNLPSTN